MGRASRRKKEKLLQIPTKPVRPKPKGFAPVEPDDDFDLYFSDDDDFLEELYDPAIHNPFIKFIKKPENPTLNLPDDELYAACVCDGEIEGDSIWLPAFIGSLDECVECLKTVILMNYDGQLRGLGLEPAAWEAKHMENFQHIKQQCLEQGRAKIEGFWFITSKKKDPSFFEEPAYLEDE
ncbi:hypothetical protein [Tolypothrix sp. VBCCA 56010]|uniref:hypothetical protein n=1 Tax=Tolypothrix sp. VBCCA 56010 TaxID=3137731 RepID=UPI003D7ED21E